jgi:N-formylglutamate amidohydrolase
MPSPQGRPLESPFDLTLPSGGGTGPLVYASPHSGRLYPERLRAASRLQGLALRRSEDAFVDRLIAAAPEYGVPLLAARYARAFVDLNRDPWELDPAMFAEPLPSFIKARSARVAAGLGAIARIVAEGQDIYRGKLDFAEAAERIEAVHRPYHETLATLIRTRLAANGLCILVDWHSMPAAAAGGRGSAPDIVLGDLYGAAAGPEVTRRLERAFEALGYRVARNTPFAGAYTTERHGCPAEGVHVVQVEINRALYLDEATLEPTAGFAPLAEALARLTQDLAQEAWPIRRSAQAA